MATNESTNPRRPEQNLRDLSHGEVITRPTSYPGEQTEVQAMVSATKNNQRWPGLIYEIVQGAIDYDDWTQGSPRIDIFMVGQVEPISLAQFTRDFSDSQLSGSGKPMAQVDRIVVANHILKDNGLRPANLFLTQHIGLGKDPTLGTHGRGLKIAATALQSGNLAHKITFSSYAPQVGAWYGEAVLTTDDVDPSVPPSLALRYKHDVQLQTNHTEVTIHQPSAELCAALAELSNWFLPTNPNYRFSRLEDEDEPENPAGIPNKATIFANASRIQEPNDAVFSAHDLQEWGHAGLERVGGLEPPRVEVLSPEVIGGAPAVIDFVFIDGLRVHVPSAKFAQIYAFWGWSQGRYENYSPKRSNDSLRMDNSARALLAKSLCLCSNPDVFFAILDSVTKTSSMYEASIYLYELSDLSGNDAAARALRSAWLRLCQDRSVAATTYLVGDNRELINRAQTEKKPFICVKSNAWVEALTACMPGLKTLEAVFQEEDELRRVENAKLQDKLSKAEHDKERAVAEATAAALLGRGITREATDTGEVLMLSKPERPLDTLEVAKLTLLHVLSYSQGRIVRSDDPRFLVLETKADHLINLPGNTHELGELSIFMRDFLAVFGDKYEVEIRVIVNGRGVYFRFVRSQVPNAQQNLSIHVQKGEVVVDQPSLIRISCLPKNLLAEGDPWARLPEAKFHAFNQSIESAVSELSDEKGIVADRYLASDYYAKYPTNTNLVAYRRYEAEVQSLGPRIQELNKLRARAGLEPITDLDESNRTVGGTDKVRSTSNQGQEVYGSLSAGVVSKILNLIHPDSVPGLSEAGEVERRRAVWSESDPQSKLGQILRDRLRRTLRRSIDPDFNLASGETAGITGYLVSHINPNSADISTKDYDVLPPLPFDSKRYLPHLRFNKPILPGLHTLLCPPGYKPASYSHPDGKFNIIFSGLPAKGVYAFTTSEATPPGLTFYFTIDDHVDRTEPGKTEKSPITDLELLLPPWRNLITALRASQMTNKQKHDALLTAWTQAFNYDNSQETFDLYKDVRHDSKHFVASIINHAAGDCGYSERGFRGLTSLVGIPSRELASFLSDDFGSFTQGINYHAMQQSYLEDVRVPGTYRWVYVEPQATYVDPEYQWEPLPAEFYDQIFPLLSQIPLSEINKLSASAMGGANDMPPLLGENMPPLPNLKSDMKEAIAVEINRRSRLKNLGILGTGAALSSYFVTKFGPQFAVKFTALVDKLQHIQTKAVPKMIEQAESLPDFIHQIPPEMIVPALLIGSGAILASGGLIAVGRALERRKYMRGFVPTQPTQPTMPTQPIVPDLWSRGYNLNSTTTSEYSVNDDF